jgi:hypothetical protein
MLRAAALRMSVVILFVTAPLFGAAQKLSDDVLAPLRQRKLPSRVVITGLPVHDSGRSVVALEEFELWTPSARIVIHGDKGTTYKTPPATRFYRGLVNDDPESFAYFTVDENRRVGGLIVVGDRMLSVASVARIRKNRGTARTIDGSVEGFDHFLLENEPQGPAESTGEPWTCQIDRRGIDASTPLRATGVDGLPVTTQGISGTQSYAMTLEIQTDNEFYVQGAGSNATTATNYATNLVGALATIYNRDLNVNVKLGSVNLWTTAADPWTTSDPGTGLDQLAAYYNNEIGGFPHAARSTSAVAMLSGKNVAAGIASLGRICLSDAGSVGNRFGPYSWNGGIGELFGSPGFGTIPNPDATENGVQYGMPIAFLPDGKNSWPLAELSHELGHNMGADHTHCMALTPAEVISTGRSFVDTCYNGDGAGCYSPPPVLPITCDVNGFCSPVVPEKGTLMSYCHNIFVSGYPQSRYLFGKASEMSHHVLDDYLLRAGGPIAGGPSNIVSGTAAFTMSTITAPASVGASSAGNAASITAIGGATYDWDITNGTITGGETTNAITFTAGATGTVILRATAYGSNRCGVTDTKNVTIGAALAAPTNVVATATGATSVAVTWTASAGATGYEIFRSDAPNAFVSIGTVGAVTNYNDNAASTNKSYLYRVRATNGGSVSPDSAADFATVVVYTDPTVTAGATTIKVAHLTDLRQAVNAMHLLANLGAVAFTDPVVSSSLAVKAVHITELRTHMDMARTTLGFSAGTYGIDPTITAGATTVKAAHITELRTAAQ